MKKSLLIAASLASLVTLTGCPADNNPSNPATPTPGGSSSPSPEVTPTPGPTVTPTPTPTATPTPVVTPEPVETPLPTPTPEANVGFALTSAVAVESSERPFAYDYTITGTGLGAIADYRDLQITDSGSTVKIIVNSVAKNNVEITNVVVTPTEIKFRWLPPHGAPTDQNLIKITYDVIGDAQDRVSTSVRLAVPSDGV